MTRRTPLTDIYFPPVDEADEDGLLMWGGELTPAWLLAGYQRGIFAWPCDADESVPVPWFSPDPRAIFEFERFHVSRRLRATIASGKYHVTFDRDFEGVLCGCTERRDEDGPSWLTSPLRSALAELHREGHSHSVEAWRDGRLTGGVYGVALGGYFSAESMFFRERDASKVALAALIEHLRQRGYVLVDIQVATPHSLSLGASEIPRPHFLRRLEVALALPVTFDSS